MRKIDSIIWKETGYIAIWVLILSVLMHAVFLLIGKWDYTVLLGNILSAFVGILNFFLMGVFLTMALNKEEKEAKQATKLSQMLRMFIVFVIVVVGVLMDCFNTWAVIIPLIFPRIGIAFRAFFDAKKQAANKTSGEGEILQQGSTAGQPDGMSVTEISDSEVLDSNPSAEKCDGVASESDEANMTDGVEGED